MGHIFKQTYTVAGPDGARVTRESRKWYLEFRTPAGERIRRAGYTDRKATERLLAKLEDEAAQVAAGMIPASDSGLRKPLAQLLAGYLNRLRADGDTLDHVELVAHRCNAILAGVPFGRWADLAPDKLVKFLAGLRTREKRPLSVQSTNHYLRQFRGFTTWLSRQLKQPDPLAGLSVQPVEAHRKLTRRTLVADEFAKLVKATAAGPIHAGLPGPDRAVLYLIAAYTGLRASELASLAAESFLLDAVPPAVELDAARAKNRQAARLPLHPSLIPGLRLWLAGRTGLLWPGNWAKSNRGGKGMREDLERAGLAYRDGRGRQFDFHSLRAQFITGLALAGVSVTEAQKLARHSTPVLTANWYSLLGVSDLAKAAARLPEPPSAA